MNIFQKKLNYSLILFLLAASLTSGESQRELKIWNPYLELDQMLCIKFGTEYRFNEQWGFKGSLGFSPLGITVFSYDLAGIYHFRDYKKAFQLDTEFGLNLAAFDLLEGNVVDWDPIIDDPWSGWAPGINIRWAYQSHWGTLALKTGVYYYMEYQRDSGWRVPAFIPEVTLEWQFR